MTPQEAIRRLRDHFVIHDDGRPTPYLNEAVRMAYEALEKQVPKKPTHIDKNGKFDGNWIKVCPVCGMKFVERFTTEDMSYPTIYHIAKYCECGQALDWGDADD